MVGFGDGCVGFCHELFGQCQACAIPLHDQLQRLKQVRGCSNDCATGVELLNGLAPVAAQETEAAIGVQNAVNAAGVGVGVAFLSCLCGSEPVDSYRSVPIHISELPMRQ